MNANLALSVQWGELSSSLQGVSRQALAIHGQIGRHRPV